MTTRKKTTVQSIRQGDVLLTPINSLPAGVVDITPPEGRVVLAYGEVTGHAHAIYERGTEAAPTVRLWSAGVERFLQVLAPVALKHEEHRHPVLPPGIYRLPAQMEYAPAEWEGPQPRLLPLRIVED
jgi:hypothetical protein